GGAQRNLGEIRVIAKPADGLARGVGQRLCAGTCEDAAQQIDPQERLGGESRGSSRDVLRYACAHPGKRKRHQEEGQCIDATGDRLVTAQSIENGAGDIGRRKEQGGLDAGKSANQAIAPALIPEEGPEEAPGCHAQTSNPTACKREKREL